MVAPGDLYGPQHSPARCAAKKIIRFAGQLLTVGVDFYNLLNNNVTLLFTPTFVPNVAGWQAPTFTS